MVYKGFIITFDVSHSGVYRVDSEYQSWWCDSFRLAVEFIRVIKKQTQKKETLEEMISADAYDEIESKVKEKVGVKSFEYVFPCIKKALEDGGEEVRRKILIDWLDCTKVRVCSQCGSIMERGWHLNMHGYACSDWCAAIIEGITFSEFKKYRAYKDEIITYLEDHGDNRKIENLSQEEIEYIIDEIFDDVDVYFTEWY